MSNPICNKYCSWDSLKLLFCAVFCFFRIVRRTWRRVRCDRNRERCCRVPLDPRASSWTNGARRKKGLRHCERQQRLIKVLASSSTGENTKKKGRVKRKKEKRYWRNRLVPRLLLTVAGAPEWNRVAGLATPDTAANLQRVRTQWAPGQRSPAKIDCELQSWYSSFSPVRF